MSPNESTLINALCDYITGQKPTFGEFITDIRQNYYGWWHTIIFHRYKTNRINRTVQLFVLGNTDFQNTIKIQFMVHRNIFDNLPATYLFDLNNPDNMNCFDYLLNTHNWVNLSKLGKDINAGYKKDPFKVGRRRASN